MKGGNEREGSDRQYRVNHKVRAEVRCGLWVGQSEDGTPLKAKDSAHRYAKARGGSPQVTQCRHFVTPSESSGEGLRHHLTGCIYIGSILTQLHTFGLITVVCRPAQLFAFIRLAFFWGGNFLEVTRTNTHCATPFKRKRLA